MVDVLFHGSSFLVPELKPSFLITGEKVTWDVTESNEFLYATPDQEEAISQALASYIEKKYLLNRYRTSPGRIEIQFEDNSIPTQQDIADIVIFLYKIDAKRGPKWIHNKNEHNGMQDEYKTKEVIPANYILETTPIKMKDWLKGKKLILIGQEKPKYINW